MASGARSLRYCMRWRCGCWCRCCSPVGRRAEGEASVVGLLQCVGWLDPVGRHSDRCVAHKELQRFLSPREDLVGAAVRGRRKTSVQSRRSLCTNVAGEAWRAAGTGLRRVMCRRSCAMRWAGSAGSAAGVSSSPGMRRGSPYRSSATDASRSALYDARIPR
jgi:hypothetical protein